MIKITRHTTTYKPGRYPLTHGISRTPYLVQLNGKKNWHRVHGIDTHQHYYERLYIRLNGTLRRITLNEILTTPAGRK